MVLKPGMGLAVSVQARENPTGPIIGLGARTVGLKFVSLNTKVRLKYQVFCYHISECQSRGCGAVES